MYQISLFNILNNQQLVTQLNINRFYFDEQVTKLDDEAESEQTPSYQRAKSKEKAETAEYKPTRYVNLKLFMLVLRI